MAAVSVASHSIEALLFWRATLARTFGNVEDDGGASSVELILEMSAAGRREVVDLIEQIAQLEGDARPEPSEVRAHRVSSLRNARGATPISERR